MAIPASPFSADATNASDQASDQIARKQRINALLGRGGSLGDLFSGEDDTSDLSKNPLNQGDTSSPLATPSPSTNAPGDVSNLATELVSRAPVVNFTAAPILTGQQQADAAVSEAERGEVGSIGGTGGTPRMDTAARNRSLMSFFQPSQTDANQPAQDSQAQQTQQPSDLMKAASAGKSALGVGGKLRHLFTDQSTVPGEQESFGINTVNERPAGSAGTVVEADPNFDIPFAKPDASGLTSADYLTGAEAEMGPTTASGGTSSGFGFSVSPSTAAGAAGGLLGLAGGLMNNQDVKNAGTGLGMASKAYDIGQTGGAATATLPADASMLNQSMAAGGGMAGAATNVGFGMAAGAANAEASKYISERMGPIAGQITNTLANLAQVAGPLGTAAGMFLSGIMGAIASGFSSPVYAEHRDQASQSIQELLPVISDAISHVRTPEDFQQLQNVVNSMAQRWSLNSGGITGGYEAGGDIGSQFNPFFTQALPLLEARGPAGPGEQSFSDWFKNYALQRYGSDAFYSQPTGDPDFNENPTGIYSTGMGSRLANVLGISPAEEEAYLRANRPDLYDLFAPEKQIWARYGADSASSNAL